MNTPDKSATVPVVPMNLFPTMGSLQEVIAYAKAQLPITNDNMLMSIIGTYHNTLLSLQSKGE
jgi:hypothetical protein